MHVRGAERRVEDRACAKSAITRGKKRMGNVARASREAKDVQVCATKMLLLGCTFPGVYLVHT